MRGFRFPSSPRHVGSGSGKSPRILLFDRGPSFRPDLRSPSRRAQWRSRMARLRGHRLRRRAASLTAASTTAASCAVGAHGRPRAPIQPSESWHEGSSKSALMLSRAPWSDRKSLTQRRAGSLWTHLGKPGRGGKICQLRFLKRQLVLPVSMMSQWWVRRSSMAVVILASPKTWGQSAKARLVVISSEVFS
jgi:hypothetical protein